MKNSLSGRFTLTLIILAVSGIMLSGMLANLALSYNFRRYLRNTEEAQNRRIVETLEELYSEATSWLAIRRSTMHVGATTGTQIRVFDLNGQLIADSLAGMVQGMHGRRWQRAGEQRGNTYNYALELNGRRVGTVEITHLGQSGLFTGEALVFRRAVNQAMLLTGLTTVLAALLTGNFLARRLTGRLDKMAEAAEKLGRGEFETRVDDTGDDELAVLAGTMNRMAERLQEQTKLRRKLTGDISHELRTPLTTIQSFVEAFLDRVMPPDEQNLAAVLEETQRLGQLVSDLQELSSAECRDRELCLEETDLEAVLARETERVKPLFRQKEIDLVFIRREPGAGVLADETMLERVIGNLLVNAWKYTPEGGRVEVTAFSRPRTAGFTVADTGIGIAEEHLPYIFERFYRADPSRSRATGGTGIGLSIVSELVRAMGGSIEVKSAPGEGSAFTVILRATQKRTD